MSIMDLIDARKKAVSRKQTKKSLKVAALSATVGLTIGAVAAVLLTPKSGRKVRDDLVSAAKDLPEKTELALEMVKEKVQKAKEKLKATKNHSSDDLAVMEQDLDK